MIFKDYYKILELNDNKVSPEEIKQAYREQAKKYHPDINTENQFSEERFKDINEAYKVLSNQSTKRKYDRMWNTHVGKKKKNQYEESKRGKGSIFSDFFQMFFGDTTITQREQTKSDNSKNRKTPIKGENIETEIKVTIFEAFYGVEKKISLRTLNGKMKSFSIKIPAGIRNGEKIRLMGQGKPGENGAKSGDLLIKIFIEDAPNCKLQGFDLYTNLYLTPWEAALGTKVEVLSIDEPVSLYVPQGMQSGESIRIQAKGYHDGKAGRGDLIATVQIMVPKDINQEEKKLMEQLKQISKYNPRKIYGQHNK